MNASAQERVGPVIEVVRSASAELELMVVNEVPADDDGGEGRCWERGREDRVRQQPVGLPQSLVLLASSDDVAMFEERLAERDLQKSVLVGSVWHCVHDPGPFSQVFDVLKDSSGIVRPVGTRGVVKELCFDTPRGSPLLSIAF